MLQSKVGGTGHTPIGPSISDVDNENINNPTASLSSPSHLSDMGSKSFEQQLDSLLSIPSLDEFLKIASENHHNNKDDNDNMEDELSRLRALELDLSQELNRFELHEEDVMNESRFDVSYDGTFDEELVYDDGSIVSSIDMEETLNDNECQYNDETIVGDYRLSSSGCNYLYGMLSQTWKSTSKMFSSPLVVVALLMKVLHNSRMASYALK